MFKSMKQKYEANKDIIVVTLTATAIVAASVAATLAKRFYDNQQGVQDIAADVADHGYADMCSKDGHHWQLTKLD